MSYIKRLLERESADGTICRYGNRQAELYQRLLDDIKFSRGGTVAREVCRTVTRPLKSVPDAQLNLEIFG